MATRNTAAARAPRPDTSRPDGRPARPASPALDVVGRGEVVAAGRRRQTRALAVLAAACLAIPLLLAAAGHAVVASNQVTSDNLQTEIAQALQTQQDLQLQKAELVAPTRILSIAETRLHMVTPASIAYLPPVNPGESVAQAHESGRVGTVVVSDSGTGAKSTLSVKGSAGLKGPTAPGSAP